MENEPNIFEQNKAQTEAAAQPAEASVFDQAKGGEATPPKKNKTGLIIGIVVGSLVVIGAIVTIVLVLVLGNKPDYDKMNEALASVQEVDLATDVGNVDFEDVSDGSLSKVSHDRTIKEAREAVSTLREYADKIEESVKELEGAGATKEETVKKRFEAYKKQANSITPKLRSMANDMEKYIEFGEKFYNSELKGISAGEDYSKLATLDEEAIDEIFAPLQEAESEGLRNLGEVTAKIMKAMVQFYSKYADYLDGTKEVTEQIRDQILDDMEEIENQQEDLSDMMTDSVFDDIFELKDTDLDDFNEALEALSKVIDKGLNL